MNEQVLDISEALQVMTDEIRNMRKTIESQYSEICRFNRKTDRLNAELHKRNKKIEELEETLDKCEIPKQGFRQQQYTTVEGRHKEQDHPPHKVTPQTNRKESGRATGTQRDLSCDDRHCESVTILGYPCFILSMDITCAPFH